MINDAEYFDIQILKERIASYEEKYASNINDIFTYMYCEQIQHILKQFYPFFSGKDKKTKKELIQKSEKQLINSILKVLSFDYDKKNHAFVSSITGNKFITNIKNKEIIERASLFKVSENNFIKWYEEYAAGLEEYINYFNENHDSDFFKEINNYMTTLRIYQALKNNENLVEKEKQKSKTLKA